MTSSSRPRISRLTWSRTPWFVIGAAVRQLVVVLSSDLGASF